MSQALILPKLIAYLQLLQKKNEATDDVYSSNLKEGHCFGFAMCYGVMKYLGALEWWKTALRAIAQWDEKEESLKVLVSMQPPDKPIMLGDLLRRVVDYIQSTQTQSIFSNDEPQIAILKPFNGFTILNKDNDIEGIVALDVVGGLLSEDDLVEILTQMPSNTLHLVKDIEHTIYIDSSEGTWTIYDANAPLAQMEEKATSASAAAKIISLILKNYLAIYACYFKNSTTPSPFKPLQGKTESFFFNCRQKNQEITTSFSSALLHDEGGAHVIIDFLPSALPELLTNLAHLKPLAKSRKLERGGWPLLHKVARHAPTVLSHWLTLVEQSPDGLAAALVHPNNDGWTGLHMVARYAPAALPQLLTLVEQSPDGLEKIAAACVHPNKEGWTGLHMIARNAPAVLSQLLTLVEQSPDGLEKIAAALVHPNKEGWTGLHSVVRNAPAVLPQLLTLVEQSPNGLEKIGAALVHPNKEGWTGLHSVARHAPAVLSQLLTLVEQSPDGLEKIAAACVHAANDGWNGLHVVARYAPAVLPNC